MGVLGHNTKFRKPYKDAILQAIRAGNHIITACELAGVAENTFYEWMKKGTAEDATKEYREFVEAVTRARAEAENDVVQTIRYAIRDPKNVIAAIKYLQLSRQDRWGTKAAEPPKDDADYQVEIAPPDDDTDTP